jgi:hypothetical protein
VTGKNQLRTPAQIELDGCNIRKTEGGYQLKTKKAKYKVKTKKAALKELRTIQFFKNQR